MLLNKSQGGSAKVAIKYNVRFIECKGTGEAACNQLSANFIHNDIRKDGGGGQVLGSESRVQWRRIANGGAVREVVNEVRKMMEMFAIRRAERQAEGMYGVTCLYRTERSSVSHVVSSSMA